MNSIVQPKQLVQAIYSPISAGESHYGTIDERGVLWMVGANDKYQLGNGTTLLSKVPVPIYFPSKVVSISCGYNSTGAVTEDGKTYLWGSTSGDLVGSRYSPPIKRPELVTDLKYKFAIKILINPTSNYGYSVIFRDGTAYIKMLVNEGISELNDTANISPGIIDVSLDYLSAYFLTRDGKIYTSGKAILPHNSKYVSDEVKGNINIGLNNLDGNPTLNPVLIPFGKIAQQISRSEDSLIVLTTEGELFLMNSYGEEGPNTVHMLDAVSIRSKPKYWEGNFELPDLQTALIKSKPQKILIPGKISFFSSNLIRSTAVTENGELYMWGIEYNSGSKVIPSLSDVKFGERTTVTIMTRTENPIQVDVGSKVRYAVTGVYFGIAVTEDRIVNYWGTDRFKQPSVIKDEWYTNCTNQESYFTFDEWNKHTDYIKIYNFNERTGNLPLKSECYIREKFIEYAKANVFADWIPYSDTTFDESGEDGKLGKRRFYKTFFNYIDHPSYLLLQDQSIREYIKKLKYPNQRIVNLKESIETGKNYGQLPGFDIYSLTPKTP